MPQGRPLRTATPDDVDEPRLIQQAQRDPARFADLYELHFERVYAYALRRLHDRAEAQDITSEVFHQALRNLGGYEWRGTPFAAWLFRIAANAIADRAKQLAREQTIAAPEPAGEPDPAEVEHQARIYRLIRELPADQRRVLELRFGEGMSIREIAAELDRSEGAIKQLQYRALETLRARVGEQNG
jgi:RNA polymerase sigma-70 factor (ECF subfamily)